MSSFCGTEDLRISGDKTLVLHVNCSGNIQLQGQPLKEVTEAKYLGIV